MRFEKFIERYRTKSSNAFNFQAILGGVYQIPCKHMFFKQFCKGYPKFHTTYATSLVFRPRKDLKMNLYFDFDFKSDTNIRIPTTAMISLCQKIFTILGETPKKWLLTRRVSAYFKQTKNVRSDNFEIL